jgi:5-formyltetrahydrofolate cyclo-ligase
MSRKQELRRLLLHHRREMSPEHRASCNAALLQQVLTWCRENARGVLALYMPIRGEPDLLPICEDLMKQGLQLALPVVVERDAPLAFAPWTPGDALHKDLANVLAPVSTQRIKPDVVITPCLGYNHLRYRLGYGAGYYDRTFAVLPGTRPVGVAWAESLVGFIADPTDMPMEVVITEEGFE